MGRKLGEDVRRFIEEELDELDELTATGDAAGFATPHAFQGDRPANKKQRDKQSKASPYDTIVEGGDPYYAYRNDETMSPRQKMGKAISEVNSQLNIIERALKMNSRLKKETGLPSSGYWKRTNNSLVKIESRMHRIAQMVREIRL